MARRSVESKVPKRKAEPKAVAKCRPPRGLRLRFCTALTKVISGTNERRAGVYVVEFYMLSEGTSRIIGVAARASAKVSGIIFNYCPYCGGKIYFFDGAKEHYKEIEGKKRK